MNSENKIINYIKKNAVYLIIAFVIVAIGLAITISLLSGGNEVGKEIEVTPVIDPIEEPTEPTFDEIEFSMPVLNPSSIIEYCDTMAYNETLNRYSAHLAMDFFADEGTEVYAVSDGKIESIENTLLYGTTITIDHGNGLKTVYNSVVESDDVFVGQSVSKGDVIATVSVTNRQEYKSGAHLHFSALENGQAINPTKYLTLIEK